MTNLVTLIGIGIVTFAATNIDDIFLLMAFFADPAFKSRQIILGQYVGIGALMVTSMVCGLVAVTIPPAYIGLLGLGPLFIGIQKLRARNEPDSAEPLPPNVHSGSAVLAIATVTVANGGDNLGVYIPLFATRDFADWGVLTAVFLILVAVWCAVGYYLVNHSTLGKPIRRFAHVLLPWVLIGLGIYIMARSTLFKPD